MNRIKYRPAGQPSARVTTVKVTQNKAALELHRGVSKARADTVMVRKGYVRAGVRA